MYTHPGTLITKPIPRPREVVITQKSIQQLDIRKGYFYKAFRTSDNAPLYILPVTVKPECDNPYVECGLWECAAASVFKSSVIFMTADKRGVQLDCHALNKRITLFVQWKDVGVLKPNESHFDCFLGFIRQGMLTHHFKQIVMQPNKVRKAIFKALDAISFGLYERYTIDDNLLLESGLYGGWNILKGDKLQVRSICLEQITTKVFNL